jgi:hypothetical protein
MNQREPLTDLTPLELSPDAKRRGKRRLRERLVKQYGEHYVALREMTSKEDVEAAESRINQLQGPCPRENAWLTEPQMYPSGDIPHVPGWSADNRLNLAVARQVYDEYVVAGKIIPRREDTEKSAPEI